MAALATIYWLTFGMGLVYIVVAGALGAVSHGLEGADADVDHDLDFDADHGIDFDVDHDVNFDADAGGGFDTADLDVGAADFDMDADADADADFDADADVGADHSASGEHGHIEGDPDVPVYRSGKRRMPRYNPFSPLSIAGFLTAFGGAGLIAMGLTEVAVLSLLIAIGGGIAMGFVLWLLIGKLLYSLQGSSEARQSDMAGLEAEVLVPVEHEMSGEIAYILEGTRYTAPARLSREGRVDRRGKVRIEGVRGNLVYVSERRSLLEE